MRDIRNKLGISKIIEDEREYGGEPVKEPAKPVKEVSEAVLIDNIVTLDYEFEKSLSNANPTALNILPLKDIISNTLTSCSDGLLITRMLISAAEFIKIDYERYFMHNREIPFQAKDEIKIKRDSKLLSYLNSMQENFNNSKYNIIEILQDTLNAMRSAVVAEGITSTPLSMMLKEVVETLPASDDFIHLLLVEYVNNFLVLKIDSPFDTLLIACSIASTCLQVVDRNTIKVLGSQ